MTEQTMPAAEAAVTHNDELVSYELAFHVLPTVAEGEVVSVFDAIKEIVAKAGATITTEEAPRRFVLAYTIEKRIDDKIRRFDSAYFGWVRFTLTSDKVETLLENVNGRADILRTMLIKLTKAEIATPFYFHEALQDEKKVIEISDEELESIAKEAAAEAEGSDTIEDEETA